MSYESELRTENRELVEIVGRLEIEMAELEEKHGEELDAIEKHYQERQKELLRVLGIPRKRADLANKILDLKGREGSGNYQVASVRFTRGENGGLGAEVYVSGGFTRPDLLGYLQRNSFPVEAEQVGRKRNGRCRVEYGGNGVTFIEQ